MPLARFIARQLGDPRGFFGRHVLVRLLNRGNDELISGALATLDLQPTDTLLDVGFGGGIGLRKAGRVVVDGTLLGVDRSGDMVAAAEERFADWIASGRLAVGRADVASLPYDDDSVTKIVTTNSVYFWPDLHAGLSELERVLAPGGRIAIGISGAKKMREHDRITRHGFRIFEPDELAAEVETAGFANPRVVIQYGRYSAGDYVIVGDHP